LGQSTDLSLADDACAVSLAAAGEVPASPTAVISYRKTKKGSKK